MASEKQIEANRRNAQLSTGPTTEEGKAAVRFNALKHGYRAQTVLFAEEEQYLQVVRDELIAEHQPQTFTEHALVEQMAVALYKRVCFEEIESEQGPDFTHARFRPSTDFIWRRQASLERSFSKSLATLQQLRRFRAQNKSAQPQPQPQPPAETPAAAEPRPEPAAATPAGPDLPKPVAAPPVQPDPPSQPEPPSQLTLVPDPPDDLAPNA